MMEAEDPFRFAPDSGTSSTTSLFSRQLYSFASSYVYPIYRCYDISCLDKPRRALIALLYFIGGIVSASVGSRKHSAAANAGIFAALTAFWILRTPFNPLPKFYDTEVMV